MRQVLASDLGLDFDLSSITDAVEAVIERFDKKYGNPGIIRFTREFMVDRPDLYNQLRGMLSDVVEWDEDYQFYHNVRGWTHWFTTPVPEGTPIVVYPVEFKDGKFVRFL